MKGASAEGLGLELSTSVLVRGLDERRWPWLLWDYDDDFGEFANEPDPYWEQDAVNDRDENDRRDRAVEEDERERIEAHE